MVQIKGTRTYIDVYIDGRVVRIQGELLVGKFAAFNMSGERILPPLSASVGGVMNFADIFYA